MTDIWVDIIDAQQQPLDCAAALAWVTHDSMGAQTLFVGRVRDVNHGRCVLGISYDVFVPLAQHSLQHICQEAQQRWGPVMSIYVAHAQGRLPVGGISVVIAVGTPHRDQAYQANRYLIEQIKQRAPIWKLEHYSDGDSQWTQGCQLCHATQDPPPE